MTRGQFASLLARALGLEPAEIKPAPWRLELVADDVTGGPTDLQAPTGDDRAFFTTKPGMVHIIADGAVSPEPFIDLNAEVRSVGSEQREQGLLGLAFHPDYAVNGQFYVFYTDLDGHNQVSQYQADPENPDRADPGSGRRIITFEQEKATHQGGQLQFGPDGYLYIAIGDDSRRENGQNPQTALGTIIRIDVDNGNPYAIPADNPYVDDEEGLSEVWAYGLRNPWRFSFDGPHIYIADVGELTLEEINIVDTTIGGINYGWDILEGTICHMPPNCDTYGLFNPQITYPRSEGLAVIGGYVYRGNAIPEMTGHYFYSDYTGGWIRTFAYIDGDIIEHYEWPQATKTSGFHNSFGIDGHGELYLLTNQSVYKIVPR